jgi:hypothetical protein
VNVSRDKGENKGKEIPSPRRSAAVVIQPLDAMLDSSTSAAWGRSGSHQIRNSDRSSEESSAPPRAEDGIGPRPVRLGPVGTEQCKAEAGEVKLVLTVGESVTVSAPRRE